MKTSTILLIAVGGFAVYYYRHQIANVIKPPTSPLTVPPGGRTAKDVPWKPGQAAAALNDIGAKGLDKGGMRGARVREGNAALAEVRAAKATSGKTASGQTVTYRTVKAVW